MKNRSVAKHRDWIFRLLYLLAVLAFLAALGAALFYLAQTFIPQLLQQVELASTIDQALNRIEPSNIPLPYGIQPEQVVVIALLLIGVLLYLAARWRIVHNKAMWQDAGCPDCHEQALARVHRKASDRFLSWTGIPVVRYYCRNCHWSGRRVRRGRKPGAWSTKTTKDFTAPFDGGYQADSGPNVTTEAGDAVSGDGQAPASTDEPALVGDSTTEARSMASILMEESELPEEPLVTPESDNGESSPTAEVVAPLGVNLRGDPHADAKLLATLRPGTVVNVLDNVQREDRITWQYIQVGNQRGWVLNAFLKHHQ